MNKLQLELLKTTAEETRNNYTHISYAPKKTWAVYNSKKLDFWVKYCEMIFNNMDDDIDEGDIRTFTLTEKLDTDSVPLMADIALRFYNPSDDEEWEPIDARFIREIVRQYQLVIEKLLDIKDVNDDMEFICMVLQSPKYIMEMPVTTLSGGNKTEEIVAVDIRLQFPFCRVEPRYHNHIRQYVIKELRHSGIFGTLTESFPIGDWNDIILPFMPNETVPLYGSVKDDQAQKPCLHFQYCYSYLIDNITDPIYANSNTRYYFGNKPKWEDCYLLLNDDKELIFPVEFHNDITTKLLTIDQLNIDQYDLKFWLPMITSMHYWNEIVLAKEEVKNRSNAKVKYGSGNRSITRIRMNSDVLNINRTDDTNILDLCELFLGMIKPYRYAKKNQWLEIGRALYTETHGDETGLSIWKSYTRAAEDKLKKIPKYFDEMYMETEYITFTDAQISVETLAWYAKHDSPEEYNKWHTQWFTESLKSCAEEAATDWKLALAFKRIYWLNIKCTNTKARHFYVFTRNKWEFIENDSKIDIMLSSEFTKYFATLRHQASEVIMGGTKDKHQRKENEKIMDEYTKIILGLENSGRKGSLIKQIANLLYDRDFAKRLDLNANIIGFGNVVMDTGGDHIEAREGKPQDYVSRCSNVLFNKNMTDDHPLVVEVLEWLHKVYPEESLFRYFMKYAASILKGKNSDKTILIFVGVGNNSKSMIVKLFEAVFGPYCVKVPVSVFTSKRKGGNATPELAQTGFARIVFLQEPDDDDTFKKGVLKEITGGDTFFARFLHDNGGKMEVLYKLALICNQVPIVEGMDKSTEERWRIMPHLGRWLKTGVPKDVEEQMTQRLFICDPFFENRVPRLCVAFLYLMHKWFPIYQKEGLVPPKLMQHATNEYFENTDIYKSFLADCFEVGDDVEERSKVSIRDMYDEFKSWYFSNLNSFCRIDKNKFKAEMSTRIGKPTGNYWSNIKFKENTEDPSIVKKNIASIINKKKDKTTLKREVVEVVEDNEDGLAEQIDDEIMEQIDKNEEEITKKKIGKLRLKKRSVNRIVEDSIPVL